MLSNKNETGQIREKNGSGELFAKENNLGH
jgi:hypothetical protein